MSKIAHFTNYSRGYILEWTDNGTDPCDSWLLLPAENLWAEWVRAVLYFLFVIYIFFGIAIGSDVFMLSIEVITSKKRKIIAFDEERQQKVEREVLIWNETVANLTLMALGSSAPEILLNVIESVRTLGDEPKDGLGTFTIVGSAAFNLLIITAICIVAIPAPDFKRIREIGVFFLTATWSIFAYVWMLLVVYVISPNVVEPWEAWITLCFFPLLVLSAWATDCGWWCHKCKKKKGAVANSDVTEEKDEEMHVRIVPPHPSGNIGKPVWGQELSVMERRASMNHGNRRQREGRDDFIFEGPTQVKLSKPINEDSERRAFARARFRHAVVSNMLGGKKVQYDPKKEAEKKKMMPVIVGTFMKEHHIGGTYAADLVGKFTFASHSYSVLESAGVLEVDVLFHRRRPVKNKVALVNGKGGFQDTSLNGNQNPIIVKGIVSVEFETREGSALEGKKFKYTASKLIFKENEYRQTIKIPIIDDTQFEPNTEFFVILKNPSGEADLGDPSVCRVVIIDDDTPGEFQFEQKQYFSHDKQTSIVAKVHRKHGSDGVVSLEYTTIDGTGMGGDKLEEGTDYVSFTEQTLEFKHGECEKTIEIPVNPASKRKSLEQQTKSFIICLKNPSLGAKIGQNSAAMCYIGGEPTMEARIAAVIGDEAEDEEDDTWAGQFRAAMQVGEGSRDENGKLIPPSKLDYIMHFLSFFWKVLFAICPPRKYGHAFPAFIVSLGFVGFLTALIEQLGHLLGCVIGLKTSVTGITIIALGTSVPDTFASRTAARGDDYADAAIGNVTGSNSVNVFLGLGLPWVLSTCYHIYKGTTYRVKSENLYQSVLVFSGCAVLCVILLVVRRKMGGELGGSKLGQWLSFSVLIFLWLSYIVISSLIAYEYFTF